MLLENKGFGNLLSVNFVRKKLIPGPTKSLHELSISDEKMLPLTGKIGKAYKVSIFFVYMMDKIPAIFFKLGVYDARPKLAHAYYVFPL